MRRCHRNEAKQFGGTHNGLSREHRAELVQRREAHSKAWELLDRGWIDAAREMAQAGITRALAVNEGIMIRLNVGGSHVNVYPSVFKGAGYSPSSSYLGDVFSTVAWDHRLPTCDDGRVFLDESPTCVVHLLRTLLATSTTGEASTAPVTFLPADDMPYFSYVSSALGMSEFLSQIGMKVNGGSTTFNPNEVVPLTAIIRRWCTCAMDNPEELDLLYRASRDGWNPQAFHARCGEGDSPTVTLFRVAGGGGRDAVVGGFSSISWAPDTSQAAPYYYRPSRSAFLFMLTNNYRASQPAKWGIKQGQEQYSVLCGSDYGPYFGRGDLAVLFSGASGTLWVVPSAFEIPAGHPVADLHERPVLEVEVFRVCSASVPASPRPAKRAKTSEIGPTDRKLGGSIGIEEVEAEIEDDVRRFGVAVADSLLEERLALTAAESELENAKGKARAAAKALTAVYGPNVAEGKRDPVVELNVHGVTMTTLRSTLQACPESSLAVMFDEQRWPPTERDKDVRGRRLVNCKPSAFAKVLDVLRMRKRAAWAQPGGGNLVRVVLMPDDRQAFDDFVDMYFAGCEGFIMDCIETA